tara:strand:+ start:1464 stop:1736 length:273 start_codon:yes stop_codon:yes gene_type:complete
MIEDLMKLKSQIDTMIETYKDLHPDTYFEYEPHIQNEIIMDKEDHEEYEKQEALKKIREGTYESTFRKKQRQETTELGEGSITLCVYGDT